MNSSPVPGRAPVGLPGLSAIKLALQARQRRTESIAALRADPVAIVGMACRMPGGADSPEELWSLIRAGRTTAGPVPPKRWDAAASHDPDVSAPGKSVTREGSFLQPADGHGIDAFDAAYFGIAPREADRMDPQQRLLLEVAYEALDDAGIDQRALAGSRTGVFIGSYHDDYTQFQAADPGSIELRTLTGTLHSVLASRMSYLLDLRGPALAVDTACSASLVAIHLACQSLRWGECDFAFAGGVSLMLSPTLMVMMSKVGFMAPDGRSKTFDAAADGFGRGEGCGVLLLRRLADAISAGDRIWAVIRGSAVNQDGRSTLLTAPNGPAQEAMIREALSAAQLEPSRIGYVETHGTGTALGDPIEVEALAAVLGRPEPEAGPCWLGGIKANLGHMEAAAGVAGVMKAALALRHRTIPPQPSFTGLNPHLPLAGTRLMVPTALEPWNTSEDRPRCAAVSAFGVGGTNAHVILEEAPDIPLPSGAHQVTETGPAWILPLSAKSAPALVARAREFLDFLHADLASIADICHSAARRTSFACRLAVVGRSRSDTTQALQRWIDQAATGANTQPSAASGVAFVFPRQGPPWFGMGRELLEGDAVFRESFMAVDALFSRLAHGSLSEALSRSTEADSRLDQTAFAQPAVFAVQVALAAVWRSWGVEPVAVVGHGVGEIAALHVAGALDLGDAVRLVGAGLDPGRDTGVSVRGADWRSKPPRIPVFSSDAVVLPPRTAFLEIGPHLAPSPSMAVLLESGRDSTPVIATSLRPGRPERETLLQAAATLFAAGVLDRPGLAQPAPARIVSLPSYPWQRQAHWLPLSAQPSPVTAQTSPGGMSVARLPGLDAEHPLIGSGLRVAGSDTWMYLASADRARFWLDQHRVLGRVLVPGAAVMEAFLAAACAVLGGPARLVDCAIQRPIEVSESGPGWQIVVRAPAGDFEEIELAWFQPASRVEGDWQSVASARAMRGGPRDATSPPAPAGGARVDEDRVYARFTALGVDFGADFRLLTDVQRVTGGASAGSASATITLPAPLVDAGFGVHPVLLDAGIQLCSVAAGHDATGGSPRDVYLPIGTEQFEFWPPAEAAWQRQPLRVHAQLHTDAADALVGDVTIFALDGTPVAALRRLRFARAEHPALQDLPLYGISWERLPTAAPARAEGRYLLVTRDDGVAQALEAELPGPWVRVVPGSGFARSTATVWHVDPKERGHWRRVLHEADWQGGTVVHASCLDAALGTPPATVDSSDLAALLHVVQTVPATRLLIVTRGAQAVGDQEPLAGLQPQSAALWGLASVIRVEEPALRLRTIDLDPAESGAAGLMRELLADDDAPAVAVRDALRWRPTLQRYARHEPTARGRRLVVQRPGIIDSLDWESVAETAPAAGEVRVRVHAAGVNFRDVLLTLGLYPGAPVPLGAECAGVVEAVGPGAAFTVGQRVFGCATACFAGAVTVPAAFLAAMPERLGMVEAAALPIAFLTALYGLQSLAGMRAGDRVLIHAAAGGVGLAAVQLAQRAGADIFATAGTPDKRSLLRAMGVKNVFDSRSVKFADEVLASTNGRGVDIVLNSLSGEFIPAGLRALAPGGRFLELGKRGVWSADAMAAARPDVAYFLYDLGSAAAADHDLLPPLYAEFLAALADGSLRALPVAEFPSSAAGQALRTMAQARHVGKLVLRIADEPPRALPRLRADGTYWITGGLSGIGLETADWLVSKGARHLVLSGRRAPSPVAQARIADFESRGARIGVRQVDAADAADMARVMSGIEAAHPLTGVVHAAGTLEDGMLANQDWARAESVLHGKLDGAWTLHHVTQRADLDFFILYSAAGVWLGPRGQGLYPAANAGLDALAHYRRRLGRPALSVAWGLWAELGMTARTAQGRDAWSVRGLGPIDPTSGFAALERLMVQNARHGIVLPIDWRRFLATLPDGMDRGFFARVGRHAPPARTAGSAAAIDDGAASAPGATRVRGLPPAERRTALVALLRDRMLAVIGLDPRSSVDPRQPLKDIGLDSLMAVELRNVLIREGGRRLPATLLFDFPSLYGLAGHLMTVWDLAVVEPLRSTVDLTEDALSAMSEAEAETLLLAELGTSDGE